MTVQLRDPNLFYHKLSTFDRVNNELILPEF